MKNFVLHIYKYEYKYIIFLDIISAKAMYKHPELNCSYVNCSTLVVQPQ